MKAVILAGGLGTRISEETHVKPKPMIEIGGMPILWHILKLYSFYGITDFVICCGYKGYVIKEYFANYMLHSSDVTISIPSNEIVVHRQRSEPWNITLVDTGEKSMTGGRLKRVEEYVKDETFCFTYGDGLSDVDINKLVEFHKSSKKLATMTAVQPPGRYGAIRFGASSSEVAGFSEKPQGDGGWVNGGFFILQPEVIDLIVDDLTIWEGSPLETLAANNQLAAFRHTGFWQPMDTLRDKILLEDLWSSQKAPWKLWT